MGTKIHKWMVLGTLSLGLGISTPCLGYVMVRSGFGDFKGEVIPYEEWTEPYLVQDSHRITFDLYRNTPDCLQGKFQYDHSYNGSVALGRRFDIFDLGAVGIEVELLGAYLKGKDSHRPTSNVEEIILPAPDIIVDVFRFDANNCWLRHHRCHYFKNQRIAGAQLNVYWEQYLLDYLSIGIGGGIGGAYICTKFNVIQWFDYLQGGAMVANSQCYFSHASKYVHAGSLLYSMTLFVRAEKFETLFEVGYRHIGLHQASDSKLYDHSLPFGTMHSDQIYLGVGRTF
ncbi:MAG: hypothetical protein MJ218_03600 [Opitutales bacterium]|nr:hypothetical protein [Opitutales bacterium]